MSVVWLWWREPTYNLCTPAGPMGVLVVTPYLVPVVGILVARFDGWCMCGLDHDIVPKMMVESKNGRKQ